MWALAGVAIRDRILSGNLSTWQAATPATQQPTQQTTAAPTNLPLPVSSERIRAAAAAFSITWRPRAAATPIGAGPRPSAASASNAHHVDAEPIPAQGVPKKEDVGRVADAASDHESSDVSAACSDDSDGETRDSEPHRNAPKYGHYGAARHDSTSRAWDERVQRQRAAETRTKRPSHAEYTKAKLSPAAIQSVIIGSHLCRNTWLDRGKTMPCHHELWATLNSDSMQILTQQREHFLSLTNRERAVAVYDALILESHVGPLHENESGPSWRRPVQRVLLRVGTSQGRVRVVCRDVFLAHYPCSLASLKRRMQEKRIGAEPGRYSTSRKDKSELAFGTSKSLHVISWCLSYAEQTSEKLPDIDQQLTPFRYIRDIFDEYVEDMKAAKADDAIVSRAWFQHVFRVAPELSKIAIASGKENFGRCTTCGNLEEALRKARMAGNAAEVTKTKEARLHHIMLERADKLAYYAFRDLARGKGTSWISCIIDKMDGNKNKCPSFVRSAKGAADELKEAMKLHVLGLIFHGKPDAVHLFPAAPHLAGNSNLNCECFMRAVRHQYGQTGMLPLLHVQLDNASDNKSRWMLGFFGWLIKLGFVKEVCLSMMMVGHTHEDINAIFRCVSDYWSRQGKCSTPSMFLQYLSSAIPGSVVHPLVEYVHDYSGFFSETIYDNVQGINEAREFILKERDDGVIACWYKPNSSHLHLYPTKKNDDGEPTKSIINGKEQYEVCQQGIEIFRTREGPTGMPPLAGFATAVADSNAPRFDPEAARRNVMTIIKELKDRFEDGDADEWNTFFDNYPLKVEDIPDARVTRVTRDWIPKCTTQLPDGRGAMHEQAEFSESIRYINPISGTRAEGRQLATARAEEREVPILTEGSVVCLLPDEESRQSRVRGERLPFWLAVVERDEEAETDGVGRRIEAISDEDTFVVSYLSVFNSRGKLTNSVVGSWKPRCKKRNARHEVHEFNQAATCRSAPHEKELENVTRASILLYDIELTNNNHVSTDSKMQIVRALRAHPESSALLPSTWRAERAPKRKRVSRKR